MTKIKAFYEAAVVWVDDHPKASVWIFTVTLAALLVAVVL